MGRFAATLLACVRPPEHLQPPRTPRLPPAPASGNSPRGAQLLREAALQETPKARAAAAARGEHPFRPRDTSGRPDESPRTPKRHRPDPDVIAAAALTIQRHYRGSVGRARARNARIKRAMARATSALQAGLAAQTAARAALQRRAAAAATIQRSVRRWLARRHPRRPSAADSSSAEPSGDTGAGSSFDPEQLAAIDCDVRMPSQVPQPPEAPPHLHARPLPHAGSFCASLRAVRRGTACTALKDGSCGCQSEHWCHSSCVHGQQLSH